MRMQEVSRMFEIELVGPLEDNAGNIITQGVVMADELNVHVSSVFTREDTIVHYLYHKQSSRDQRRKGWGSQW